MKKKTAVAAATCGVKTTARPWWLALIARRGSIGGMRENGIAEKLESILAYRAYRNTMRQRRQRRAIASSISLLLAPACALGEKALCRSNHGGGKSKKKPWHGISKAWP